MGQGETEWDTPVGKRVYVVLMCCVWRSLGDWQYRNNEEANFGNARSTYDSQPMFLVWSVCLSVWERESKESEREG